MNQVVDFINVNRDRYVDELKQYLAIPSISALPQHAADVRRAAEWTGEALKTAGLQTVRINRALADLGPGAHEAARAFLAAMIDTESRDAVLRFIARADRARRR